MRRALILAAAMATLDPSWMQLAMGFDVQGKANVFSDKVVVNFSNAGKSSCSPSYQPIGLLMGITQNFCTGGGGGNAGQPIGLLMGITYAN